jgi:xylan 1,4-beta-xylosidase
MLRPSKHNRTMRAETCHAERSEASLFAFPLVLAPFRAAGVAFAFVFRCFRPARYLLLLCLLGFPNFAPAQSTKAPAHPFPHFWEQMFGSGRAILSLRDSYRSDLRQVKQATGFEYIRFHAIFHDEVGLYDEDATGKPVLQFFLRRPDLRWAPAERRASFRRIELHAPQARRPAHRARLLVSPDGFAPPKDWAKWSDDHSSSRSILSIATESTRFPSGISKCGTSRTWISGRAIRKSKRITSFTTLPPAIKAVSPRLRVGGPSTAQAAWVDRFIRHCVENHVPSISFPRTSTATTTRRTFLEHRRIVPRTREWSAAPRQSARSGESASPRPICL